MSVRVGKIADAGARILRSRIAVFFLSVVWAASFPGGALGANPLAAALGVEVHAEAKAEIPHVSESAHGRALLEDDVPQVEARLLVSHRPLAPERDATPQTRVGVLFDLAPGWHLYWRNPGDTGIAPDLALEAPGYTVGPVAWPVPETFEEAEGLFTTYGYEGRVLLSAPLSRAPGEGAEHAPSEVHAAPHVLVCRTECVPASFELSSPLEPDLSDSDSALVERLFDDAEAKLPTPNDAFGLVASAHWKGDAPAVDESGGIMLVVDACPPMMATNEAPDCPATASDETMGAIQFLPMESDGFELSPAGVARADERAGFVRLEIEALRLEPEGLESEGLEKDRLRGLIALPSREGAPLHVEIDLPIESAATAAAAAAPISLGRWIQIFLLAMLGGLILNGMPCVLPVLAIKVVAIADLSEKDPAEVRMQGVAYTAGVLGSMAILACLVIGLRSAGHSVGWGFQFQEPLFVAGICGVLVAFALNLFGVFEIELGQGRLAHLGQEPESSGVRRSIFEGLLAVVLATPCTAPFLGTAVGFAFAASSLGILMIFLAIGTGLAFPFLAVSFAPGFARFIPRSGPWMMTLRAGLGFCLLATVVWLLWVLGQSGGTEAVIGTMAMLLFLAFLLWGFGQAQPLRSVWLGRGIASAIVILAFVGFNLIGFDQSPSSADASAGEHAEDADWTTYSDEAVRQTLAEGRPAFVVFTADWCITCQVNERTVLEREVVEQALESGDYARFKADWTRRDESIRITLSRFGRAGVPLYLVYSPADPEHPRVLSEILRTDQVLAALASSAPTKTASNP